MLIQDTMLEKMVIGSVRSSGQIGRVSRTLINPHSLHIDALFCKILGDKSEQLLSPIDIRDIGPRGIVIDDHERLIAPEDAVRLQKTIKLNFNLVGKQAFVAKQKVGAVEGYSVHSQSFFIQKIYVKPSLLKRINSSRLTFDRAQVLEVTDKIIRFSADNLVTESPAKKYSSVVPAPVAQSSASSNTLIES